MPALALCWAALLLLAGVSAPVSPARAEAADYLPTARVEYPNASGTEATAVPATVTFGFSGVDPDGPAGLPTWIRFLFTPAEVGGVPITTRYQYDLHVDQLVDFASPDWSEWRPYSTDPDDRRIVFPDLPDEQYFLFAVQTMDTNGAVSLERGYGQEVLNIQVRADYFRPQVVLNEVFLGTTITSRLTEIASGQPLNFSWIASADAYNGTIKSYRHGFDLIDPEDPNDPGWEVPPGLEPENLYSQERSFAEGYHRFYLRVEDDAGQVTALVWDLNVIPFVPPEYQYPLLVIDQVVDDQTNAWPGSNGIPYDQQAYRNAFWQFLDGPDGVSDFNWDQDRYDHTQQVTYADLIHYRSVLVYARNHSNQLMFNQFRPEDHQDRYVWLAPYQQGGGNLFLVGSQSMESFLETLPNYVAPIVFESQEEYYSLNGDTYVLGFGQAEMPDGTLVDRGPRQYGFATAGISALDWSVPLNKYIYGRTVLASSDRKASCAALKGLVLDPAFRSGHALAPGAIADTLLTDQLIDWRDDPASATDILANPFPFHGDEFVDFNISSRPTPIVVQDCAEGPDGRCIEPMFRGLARFDWLREQKWSQGDLGWPQNTYTPGELDEICGPLALTLYGEGQDAVPDGSARTNGRNYGYLSYANVADKPSGRADVYWGFDPYRFDHAQSRQAIRWVLDYFGLNLNK